jgi:hypothetical protein
MKSKDINPNLLLIIGGGFLGYKFLLVPLLESLNLMDTKEEREAEQTTSEYGGGSGKPIDQNPWSPKYITYVLTQLRTGQSAALLTVAGLNKYAKQIYDAKTWYNDDEEAVYGALRQLSSNTQLSQLAGHFQTNFKKDLYEYIRSMFNDAELAVVTNIVKGYKKGIIQNGKLS